MDDAGADHGFVFPEPAEGAAAVLRSPLLHAAGVKHGFGTRRGGVSQGVCASLNFGLKGGDAPENVQRNTERLGRSVGFDAGRLFRLTQVHGRRVVQVEQGAGPAQMWRLQGDALTTAVRGTAVGVGTADCVPVLMSDAGGRVVAAAHAGWRGLVGGVLEATLAQLRQAHGLAPEQILAAVGPCIGPCCYEVGSDVAQQFANLDGVVRPGQPRPHLDLTRAAHLVLAAAGVPSAQIDSGGELCTRCSEDLLFSYRRDGASTGLHLSVIVAK